MIGRSLILFAELVALFFGVAFLIHLAQRRLGPARLRKWMGGRPISAALKGIAVGFVTPFCTYSAIPLLVGLRRAGVTPAGYVAFIVAAPVLDPVLFGALLIIVGARAAGAYVMVAFAAALGLALIAERAGIARYLKPLTPAAAFTGSVPADRPPSPVDCADPADSDANAPWAGLHQEARTAWIAAAGLLRSLGPVLLLGVAIGLAIEALVPPEAVARLTGNNGPASIPLAAALGTPLYFSTELFVPIADALAGVGVGIGAIVALTIAGAGANLPEFVILGRLAQHRVLAVFVAYVFAIAIIGGALAAILTS